MTTVFECAVPQLGGSGSIQADIEFRFGAELINYIGL